MALQDKLNISTLSVKMKLVFSRCEVDNKIRHTGLMYLNTWLEYTEEFEDTKGVIRIRKSKGRKWPNNTHKTYT